MAVPTIVPGQPVNADWPAAVAAHLNRIEPMFLSSDQSSNSTSFADVGDLSIPVVAGRIYCGRLIIRWVPNATNQGPSFGLNHPGGTVMAYNTYRIGTAAGTVTTEERITATDTSGGESSVSNTNTRITTMDLWYACTTDGTLAIRFRRNGTSSAPGITVSAGSGGLVMVTP